MLKTGHRTRLHLRAFEFLAAHRRSRAALTCTLLASFLATMPTGGLQAGDILRGGASSANTNRNSAARANAGSAAAEVAKVRAQDRLARTTKIVNDMRVLQQSARAAVAVNSIPNGLIEGGLNPIVGGTWTGANPATASGNNVNIKQTASQALLHWRTFNVGSQTTLNFDQSAGGADSGKWIAFNKVYDPDAKPSEIHGKITAQGQVYIINQNGIIFGAGSQINARALVASSLPINDNLVSNGLLNNRNAEFLFSKDFANDPTATFGDIVVERGALLSSPEGEGGNGGRIMLVGANVQNAGEISTPSGQSILAAGLQVGVAAHAESDPSLRGLDVWVGDVGSYGGTVANSGLVESQRGSIVAVGKRITQSGVLESSTSVNLNGRIDLLASYGAVGFPGYDSSFQPPFLNRSTGIVEFSSGSTTRILPDFSSDKKIPGTKLAQSSQVNIEGLGIHFEGGSSLIATSGAIGIRAGIWPFVDTNNDGIVTDATEASQQISNGRQRFLLSGGQVNIASSALIDASGTMDAFVPLANNFLAIQLRGSELADSPLQRSGGLRGKPLLVDLRRSGSYGGRGWIGTPLGDLTGFANITERDIAQLSARGGSISISAGDSVVAASRATIDVSGGYFTHEGGLVRTSRLLRDANVVDIYNATPDVEYDGVYEGRSTLSSLKWGSTQTYTHPLAPLGGGNEHSHVEGAAAGTLSITAPKMDLAAELLGQSISGPRQQLLPAAQGTLKIKFQGETKFSTGGSNFVFLNQSPAAPNVVFSNNSPNAAPFDFKVVDGTPIEMPFTAGATFAVSSNWWEEEDGGFGNIEIENTEGDITVPSGNSLALPAGGSLKIAGRNISVNSNISAPSGSIAMTAYNYTPMAYARAAAEGLFQNVAAPAAIAGQGTVRVAKGVYLDVAGQFADERPSSIMPYQNKILLSGGTVSLTGYSVLLEPGSLVDVSGGVRGRPSGKFQYGNGGSISILAGKDPSLSTTTGGKLQLDGTLQAYSLAKGGSLSLQANTVQIGGTSAPEGTLFLQPDFFRKGGFTSFSLQGIGARATDGSYVPGVKVVSGTVIEPVAEQWRHLPMADARKLSNALSRLGDQESAQTASILAEAGSSSDLSSLGFRRMGMDALFPVLLPEGLRQPASLTLSASGYDDSFTEDRVEALGIVDFQEGAKILTDAGATVRMSGDFVRVAGEISAPGGTIEITGRSSFRLPQTTVASFALPTVHLTPSAKLSVAGKTVQLDDPYGWNAGIIHPGGTIKISGNILAESGSLLDASGTSAVLDFHPSRLDPELVGEVPASSGLNSAPWQRQAVAVRVDSDGGRIELSGSQFLYADSTLMAKAGGETALGGTLSVSSGRFYASGESRTGADTNLFVAASGQASRIASTSALSNIFSALLASSTPDAYLASTLLSATTGSQGVGFFAMDRFTSGGFDFLDLGFKYFKDASPIPYGGNLEFLESVSINAKGAVRLAGGGVIRSTFPVSVSAPYVAIGQEFLAPLNPADPYQPFREFNAGTGGTPSYNFAPSLGDGSLTVSAKLIDIGTLVTRGISNTKFTSEGDIRGNGIVSVAGKLSFQAAQMYPTTGARFDVFAYDSGATKGAISVTSTSTPSLPLSAGGRLRMFADSIQIAGNLRAPMGSIVLGWDGTASSKPENIVVGSTATLSATSSLSLAKGASLSVSGVDPTTGTEILVPYGISPDGLTWIDPRGVDITVSGLPDRGVSLAGNSVAMDSSATIDLRGGGDLLAYRWIPGVGGSSDLLGTATRSWSLGSEYNAGDLVSHSGKTWSARRDIAPADFTSSPSPSESVYWSLVPESYAVLPGAGLTFAPFNTFNSGVNSGSLSGDPGFVSSSLRVGEQVELPASSGLAEGSHTLLPRRYAILPGAFLVVPQSGSLANTSAVRSTRSPGALKSAPSNTKAVEIAEGARFVSGRTLNGLTSTTETSPVLSRFEVVPPTVIADRVQFDTYKANEFLAAAAARLDLPETQMLPKDSAPLQIQGNHRLSLEGTVLSPSVVGGRGARVDIGSDANIYLIGGEGTAPGGISAILSTPILNSWKADSLFIGGLREKSSTGTTASIRTNSITVANAGETLEAPEITLASKSSITLYAGSSLASSGPLSTSAENIAIAGDGSLLRVSGDSSASITRTGATSSSAPSLSIGDNARITGKGVILDSTNASLIAPSLNLSASALTLGSGQISVLFEPQPTGLAGSVVNNHLTLQGDFLSNAFASNSLTLQSYSTIDLYGAAASTYQLNSLKLLSSGVRGYTSAGTNIQLNASDVLFSNPNSAAGLANPTTDAGRLSITAQNIRFSENGFAIAGFNSLDLTSTNGAKADSKGSFSTTGSLSLSTPLLTASQGISYSLTASSALAMLASGGSSTLTPGLGSTLNLAGSSVSLASNIALPSGSLIATASSGDIIVSGTLKAEGTAKIFYDVTRFTDAGAIELNAKAGKVTLSNGSRVSVAAASAGGNAGSLTIKSPSGIFVNDGTISGAAGLAGLAGTFSLDAGTIATFADLSSDLASSGFSREQNLRVRNGDIAIDQNLTVQKFTLSADNGGIVVNARIDASGETGGQIELISRNNLTLSPTGSLTVAAQRFSNSGKGGHIHLEAGSAVNGSPNTAALLDLQSGSNINLSVSEFVAGDYLTAGSSAFSGKFQGTLHLRAPRSGNDVRIDQIDSTVTGASAISVEPFRIYEPAGGTMNIALRNTINTDNTSFMNAGEAAMLARLLPIGSTLGSLLAITPGVEILNKTGDLTLGLANNSNSGSSNVEALSGADWDLSSFRYGARQAPGILTLRAKDDLVFNNALSDGFTPIAQGTAANFADIGHSQMWLATPQSINTLLPINLQSWGYRFAAGSDMASTSHRSTVSADTLAGKGSILVGEFYPTVPNTATSGANAAIGKDGQTADSIRISSTTTDRGTRYEVVRTGTGDIDIAAAKDVQLRNPFATIYTAGVALPDPRRIFKIGDFSLPIVVRASRHPEQGNLGAVQQAYNPSYTMGGGLVAISAGNDIGRFTQISGQTVADASRQLPTNWLYRRGQVDPATGLFAEGGVGNPGNLGSFVDQSASTTWWIDFSNYFGGFGALGGGGVTLAAGRDLINADASVPTNARMAGLDNNQRIAPSVDKFQQLGGGDLFVTAGRNIDGGSFLVDRGGALLLAGAEVTTNSAQSPSRGNMATSGQSSLVYDELVWQPVTLFGSDSTFTVNARGNILIGAATNPFLLPQGVNNKFWYKTQFNTMNPTAALSVNSFGGAITHRLAVTLPGDSLAIPVLEAAYRQTSAISPQAAGYFRPWLRLSELNTNMFRTAATVTLPSLKSNAFGGDINIVGPLNLFPSPQGGLELLASGKLNGLNPSGITTTAVDGASQQVTAWTATSINLSDANPSALARSTAPYSIQASLGVRDALTLRDTTLNPFADFDAAFSETGAFTGEAAAIDIKSALHNPSPLHSGNPNPLRLYAAGGDLSGVTLYSAKKVQAMAMQDITDIAFYLQHTGSEDVSIVSAGRDIIPFNENSNRRATAGDLTLGNLIVDEAMDTAVDDANGTPVQTKALPGDIQIGGRGVLEVLAGRNVDLGTGPNLVDGRGKGITSIGRSRNPFLPFEGAELVVLAGVGGTSGGPAIGLAKSILNFSALKGGTPATEFAAVTAFKGLFVELARIGESALESGDYSEGYAFVNKIFGSAASTGDIFTRARDIRTANGGAITIATPGGGLTMASDIFGNPLTPPGIVTEYGGAVSILTDGDVNIGQARIFTLRGGDLTIWSSNGDIAAGNAPKTVVTAPPTRVLIDATSANIQTDLGGLATGGGIGVLAAVENVEPGAVNLIAPKGTVDAGDAGIRATGDIKIAAAAVVNADNIAAGGTSTGVPSSPTVAAPNIGGLTSGSSSSAAASSAANQVSQQSKPEEKPIEETPSLITVEVLGYGGGDSSSEKEDEETSAEG